MTTKTQKPIDGVGEIKVTGVPVTLISRLNKIARNNMGVSRNSFLKTEFFKIVEREEAKEINNKK